MARMTIRLVMVALLLVAALFVPVSLAQARCPDLDAWPSFTELAPDARRVLLGTVTLSVDGIAAELRVDEVLRGQSRRALDLDRLRSRLPRADASTCAFDGMIRADEGDRLAIALSGTVEGWRGLVDTAALVDAALDHPNASKLERLTSSAVRFMAASPMSPAATPRARARSVDPLDPLRALFRAVVGVPPGRFLDDLLAVPWPARPPAPLPPGATALGLAVAPPAPPRRPRERGWGCAEAAYSGRLIVDDGELVTDAEPVIWPRGFSARVSSGGAELVSPDGTVVGVEGDLMELGGGYLGVGADVPGDEVFIACTVAGVSYPPAS